MAMFYKDLIVWQKAMSLTVEAYRLVRMLPKDEAFVLSDQIRRAAISIPSNIAEGHSRNSTKEFLNFLSIARGSNAELETQLELGIRLAYFPQEQGEKAVALAEEVGRMLTAIISKISTDASNNPTKR